MGATRLLLVSNGDDAVATRLALIGLGASGRPFAWGRDGRTRLTRAAGETESEWLSRVLGAWGVPTATASNEISRYLALRKP